MKQLQIVTQGGKEHAILLKQNEPKKKKKRENKDNFGGRGPHKKIKCFDEVQACGTYD